MVLHGLLQKPLLDARLLARYRIRPGKSGWRLLTVCRTGETVVGSFESYSAALSYLVAKMPPAEGYTAHIDRSARAETHPRTQGQS